jgi:hypothetical protein
VSRRASFLFIGNITSQLTFWSSETIFGAAIPAQGV